MRSCQNHLNIDVPQTIIFFIFLLKTNSITKYQLLEKNYFRYFPDEPPRFAPSADRKPVPKVSSEAGEMHGHAGVCLFLTGL